MLLHMSYEARGHGSGLNILALYVSAGFLVLVACCCCCGGGACDDDDDDDDDDDHGDDGGDGRRDATGGPRGASVHLPGDLR